jgi:hypothetical protein
MLIRHYPVIIVAISSSSTRLRLIYSEEEYILFVLLLETDTILFYEVNTLESQFKEKLQRSI